MCTDELQATIDPYVWIEEQRSDYVRYRQLNQESLTIRRWEVHGVCNHNRACLVGAVIDGVVIETVEQARALPMPELDCPVAPGFDGCCPLEVVEL